MSQIPSSNVPPPPLVLKQPTIGEAGASFTLPSTSEAVLDFSVFAGKPLVMLFCPKVSEPNSLQTLEEFRDAHSQFAQRGVEVVCISVDSMEALRSAATEHRIPFPLLSDTQLQAGM